MTKGSYMRLVRFIEGATRGKYNKKLPLKSQVKINIHSIEKGYHQNTRQPR